ncbi:MAG: peptidylprolyl isomerase [Candidatus Sumerlaeaceae bacterium]|nr:peptidylprolyl isomerase [Candidatus Sumerlaeaceae bacterium]
MQMVSLKVLTTRCLILGCCLAFLGTVLSANAAEADLNVKSTRGASSKYMSSLNGGEPVQQLVQPSRRIEASAAEHPLFKSPYIGEEDRVVATTKYGKVTARDLYLWILASESKTPAFILEQYDRSKLKTEREKLAKRIQKEIEDYVFTNYVIPKLVGTPECTMNGAWKEYVYSLPGYQLAYLRCIVKPLVVIQPADLIKYMQEHKAEVANTTRWRTRYIFIESDEKGTIEDRLAAEEQAKGIRDRIASGEISFADAAKENSQAASAENGGEIPPFKKGELFFLYENAAASLQPGEISEVFRGPNGLYIVQLLEVLPAEEPTLDNPDHAKRAEEAVLCKTLRGQYDFESEQLFKKRLIDMRNNRWDERACDEPIGQVDSFKLVKQQFQELFPEIEDENLVRRDDLISQHLRAILEREAMAQEVREEGWEQDCDLQRMKTMAANRVKRDCFLNSLYCNLKVDEAKVRSFWANNPELFTPLMMKRVVKITLTPTNLAPEPKQLQDELATVLADATGGDAVTIPTPSPDDEKPKAGQPKKGPQRPQDNQPAKYAVPGFKGRGGAGDPESAAGGVKKSYNTEDSAKSPAVENGGTGKSGDLKLQPGQPMIGIGNSAMLLPPARRPLVPPLPLTYFKRLDPTKFRETVLKYQNGDYVLRYDDYGFIYLEDRPEIPKGVRQVPVGSYSAPIPAGNAAVSYYIEEGRKLDKPGFADVKTYAYSAYRQMTVDKEFQNAYKDGVAGADIEFKF